MLFLLSACLIALGCVSSPKSKPAAAPAQPTSNTSAPTNSQPPFWAQADNPRPAPPLNQPNNLQPASANQNEYGGVLAGSLVDSFNRAIPRASLQVVAADGQGNKPVDIEVVNGYFVVPGLNPGRAYMLTARTYDGDRKLAGRVQAIPPNPRVVIKVSEDLFSSTVPAPLPTPGEPNANNNPNPRNGRSVPDVPAAEGRSQGPRFDNGDGWQRNGASGNNSRGDAAPPPPLDPQPKDTDRIPPTGQPFNSENIAGRDREQGQRRPPPPPIIDVPGPGSGTGNSPLPEPDPTPSGSGGRPMGPEAYRISTQPQQSFCTFIAPNRLQDFALKDPYGRTWAFSQHRGQLVLLDFWGTWCMPCVRAIPHIKQLQAEYGQSGLEVIGIACERSSGAERSQRVKEAIDRYQINYRVILGEEYEECPVQQKFHISSYPTLVLLDTNGKILWRGNPSGFAQLEAILKRELKNNR
jgi:thiol-disulfide isomerase/thioredoxin